MNTRFAFASLIVCVLFSALAARAQTIPNGNYEQWNGDTPANWNVDANDVNKYLAPTSTAHSGSFAAHGLVAPQPIITGVSPQLRAGTDGKGFPMGGARPGALRGFYKFHSTSSDMLTINFTAQAAGTAMGNVLLMLQNSTITYKQFVANIEYYTTEAPDTGTIEIEFNPLSGCHPGSTFDIDDLTFGPADVGVDASTAGMPTELSLGANYPNPFSATTSIIYTLPAAAHVRLTMFDALGRAVATPVDESQTAGTYKAIVDGSSRPAGLYTYIITAGGASRSGTTLISR